MTGRLIGLGGLLRSGKDTVADYLVDEHGWVKLNMSDPLNEALQELNPIVEMRWSYDEGADGAVIGVTYRNLIREKGYVEAKKNPEVRRLLQVLGTEIGRKMIDENVWVNIAANKILALQAQDKNVAITGIRYPNELAMINALEGQSVWVERPDLIRKEGADHSSENSVSLVDFGVVLLNNGTIENLYRVVDEALQL